MSHRASQGNRVAGAWLVIEFHLANEAPIDARPDLDVKRLSHCHTAVLMRNHQYGLQFSSEGVSETGVEFRDL